MKPALWKAVVVAGALAAGSAWAQEEGPGRGVARISVISGDVSVRRGDSGEWVAAAINAPLVVQDRVFCGPVSRAELQFDYANMVRIDENSEIRLSELEYRRYQVQVARGTVTFRVLRDSNADVELSTPNVSVRPVRRGSYRVTVRDDGSSEITVRSGEVEVYTPRGSERLTAGRTMLARGTASDPEFQIVAAVRTDDWDRWNERRDRDLERTRSYQYVSSDIYGAEDLDPYGEWIYVAPYGYVWAPRVAWGWAPYRYGHWSWIDWYGWSWISYDPWGWAPYHYGRWFYHGTRWCWWPGARHHRHYWSPGLVAFFGWGRGGVGLGIGFGNVGWVPLAPYEPYYPWYGHRYYSGYRNRSYIDNSVHIVNNINITNVYRNSRVNNGVTAVNAGDFSRGRGGNFVKVSDSELRGAGLVRGQLPLAPERDSLRLSNREVRSTAIPRSGGAERFYSRRQPANVERVAFDDQRRGLEQVARRTFAGPRVAESAGPARVMNADERRAGGGRTDGEPSRGAWRRAEEGSRTETGVRGGESPRPAEAGRAESRSGEAAGGWRRFEGSPRVDATGRNREATGGFARTTETPAPGRADMPASPGDSNGGWRRFEGSPRVDGAGANRGDWSGSRRTIEVPSRQEGRPADGWRRFEPATRVPETRSGDVGSRRMEMPRYEQPRSEAPRYERPAPEPLRVSPPIVRERSSPRWDGGAGGGSRIPESRPQMSAPSPRTGGGELRGGGGIRSSGGGEMRGGGGGSRGEGRSGGRGR